MGQSYKRGQPPKKGAVPYKDDFENFGEKIWLNAASEGPLPKVAAQALKESIVWKSLPYQLDISKFISVPRDLKISIGKLIGVDHKDVILANSASYGIHLLANGLKWSKGDEICLMQNDFPSDILPWLALEKQGVKVIQVKAKNRVLSPEELLGTINAKTKLVCLPHVHTFSGEILNIKSLSEICSDKGIIFVLNISQSAGTMPIDLSGLNVDAVVCAGYKWLLGPYGTGFAWMTEELRNQLDINRAYWIASMTDEELQSEDALKYKDVRSSRKLDVFGTANFFNFVPFRASVDYINSIGLEEIRTYHQALAGRFISSLESTQYELLSPIEEEKRSSLIVISHKNPSRNKEIFTNLSSRGIYGAFWKGNIRFSPHIYNDLNDIQKLIEILISFQ